MKIETYSCDLCNTIVKGSELQNITVGLEIVPKGFISKRAVRISKDVCRSCLEAKGILTELSKDSREDARALDEANTKTLESKLLDILEDLGVKFEE